jgi:hypothetical protein
MLTKRETNDDSPGHHLTEMINELAKMEYSGEVESSSCDESDIPASKSVAIVLEPLAA